jgi:alanine-synthesizing transaminase
VFASRTEWNVTTNRLTAALERHRAAGRELLDLTVSNPTACGIRYNTERILNSISNPGALHYQPDPRGLQSARAAIADYYRELNTAIAADDLIVSTSTSEGYSFCFRLLCGPGDEVLVPAPSYPLFQFLADIQDVKLVTYPLFYDHDWHIDLHTLAARITSRTRAILLVNPNNPTGSYVKAHEREQLNELCRKRELALISDEVFFDYLLSNQDRASLSFSSNQEALSFTLSGLSKISALPQMKVAWIAVSGPGEMKQTALSRLEIIADTYLSVNTPVQLAVPVLLEERRSVQPQLRERIETNLRELDSQLALQTACCRLGIEGGWYAILRVPVIGSDEDLAVALLEQRCVFVHPGHFYDFPSDGHVVVSLITPKQTFREGVYRLLQLF